MNPVIHAPPNTDRSLHRVRADLGALPVRGEADVRGRQSTDEVTFTLGAYLSPTLGRPSGHGTPAVLRRARTDDLDAVDELHSRCSSQSLRARYGSARDRLRASEWRRLSAPDSGHTLIAQLADGPHHLIAFAGLMRTGRPAVGELSVLVADDWQGMGLGTLLVRHLTDIARRRGDSGVEAVTTRSNTRALRILRGLNADLRHQAPGHVSGWLPLSAPEQE